MAEEESGAEPSVASVKATKSSAGTARLLYDVNPDHILREVNIQVDRMSKKLNDNKEKLIDGKMALYQAIRNKGKKPKNEEDGDEEEEDDDSCICSRKDKRFSCLKCPKPLLWVPKNAPLVRVKKTIKSILTGHPFEKKCYCQRKVCTCFLTNLGKDKIPCSPPDPEPEKIKVPCSCDSPQGGCGSCGDKPNKQGQGNKPRGPIDRSKCCCVDPRAMEYADLKLEAEAMSGECRCVPAPEKPTGKPSSKPTEHTSTAGSVKTPPATGGGETAKSGRGELSGNGEETAKPEEDELNDNDEGTAKSEGDELSVNGEEAAKSDGDDVSVIGEEAAKSEGDELSSTGEETAKGSVAGDKKESKPHDSTCPVYDICTGGIVHQPEPEKEYKECTCQPEMPRLTPTQKVRIDFRKDAMDEIGKIMNYLDKMSKERKIPPDYVRKYRRIKPSADEICGPPGPDRVYPEKKLPVCSPCCVAAKAASARSGGTVDRAWCRKNECGLPKDEIEEQPEEESDKQSEEQPECCADKDEEGNDVGEEGDGCIC